MNPPKVSIIIPVYNAFKHLKECLDSVIGQTLKEIEIICVDDGSTDDSLRILREYENADQRIKVLTQKNQFAGVARNTGMDAATGEYYAFLDADDFFDLESLEKLYQAAIAHQLDLIKTYSYIFDEQKQQVTIDPYFVFSQIRKEQLNKVYSFKSDVKMLHSVADVPWNGLYRANFLKRNNIHFNHLQCSNDHSFFVDCICHARVMLTDIVLTYYRTRQVDSLISVRSRHFECQIQSHEISKEIILQSNIKQNDKKELLKRELNSLFRWFHRLERDTGNLFENGNIMQRFVSEYDVSYLGLHYLKEFPFQADFWKFYAQDFYGSRPEISIVIPVYNDEKYVEECLRSVLAQSLREIEIILVDDGSSDHSLRIMQKYAKKDPRIHIIRKEHNQGAFAARRSGMLNARGKYLMFVDADDVLVPEACQLACDLIKKKRTDIVQFTVGVKNCTENPNASHWAEKALKPSNISLEGQKILKELFVTRRYTTALYGKIYLTSLCKSAALHMPDIESSLGEDILQQFYIAYLADSYEAVQTAPLYYYRYGLGVSNVQPVTLKKFEGYCKMAHLAELVRSFLTERGEFERFQEIYEAISQRMCEDGCRMYRTRVHENDRLAGFYLLCAYWGQNPVFARVAERMLRITLSSDGLCDNIQKACWSYTLLQQIQLFPLENIAAIVTKKSFPYLWLAAEAVFPHQNNGPKVSVIIPVYNVERYVEQCVRSVQGQTLQEVEIICVNDGSTDGSLAVIEKLSRADKRIKIVDQKNGGQSSARNAGAKVANGLYIYFLDSDDYLEPDALRVLYDECEQNQLDIVYFDANSFIDGEAKDNPDLTKKLQTYKEYYHRKHDYSRIVSGGDLFILLKKHHEYRCSPCLQMISSRFCRLHGLQFYEGIIHEDNLFTLTAILQAQRVKHVPFVFYQRRIRADSTMTSFASVKNVRGYFTCMMKTLEFLGQRSLRPDVLKAAIDEINSVYIWGTTHFYDKISTAEQAAFCAQLTPLEKFVFQRLILAEKIEKKATTVSVQKPKSSNQGPEKLSLAELDKNLAQISECLRQPELDKRFAEISARLTRIEALCRSTWFIRKLKGGVRCCREHGVMYTLKRVGQKLKGLFCR